MKSNTSCNLSLVANCLKESPPQLFTAVDKLQKEFNYSLFGSIILARSAQLSEEKTIDNLTDMFASPAYAKISQTPLEQCGGNTDREVLEILHQIETISCKIYETIGNAWAHYKLHKNEEEAKKDVSEHYTAVKTEGITGELVPDIAGDKRVFRTEGMSIPCKLKYAVKDQFLRLVIEKTWWEALFVLSLSEQGKHAICYRDEIGENYPRLLATALIQDIPDMGGEDYLLTRSRFFRTEDWRPELGREDVKKVLKAYCEQNAPIKRVNVNYDCIPEHPGSVEAFEEGFIQAVGRENVAEFIRLTFQEPDQRRGFKTFYDICQKISRTQTENGILFSFGVTESFPIVAMLKILEELTEIPCILVHSKHMLGVVQPVETSKIILLNANIPKAMEKIDVRVVIRGLSPIKKGGSIEEVIQTLRTRY